ncbi:DUF4328 domain-containing protein [Nonomuraea jiangxiensis]|uniref:DUF4328 domain-containing protein n=1 Tax=Nonomuraea jiangxiensis TaxID=633440 RepID=UPI0015A3B359|nr:DUF4328 domain-containing protein [Nonomuraea jiangxiensis]
MIHPPHGRLRPVGGVALLAIAGVVCDSLVGVATAGIDLWYASLVDRMIADTDSVSGVAIRTGELLVLGSEVARVFTFFVAAAGFLAWLFRVRTNAVSLSLNGHRHGRFWLVAGWMFPIGWFWVPRQIVDDIWRASTPPGSAKGLINAWWATWLIAWVTARTTWGLLNLFPFDLEGIAFALRLEVVGIGLMLIAAVLAIAVIRKITNAQEVLRSTPPPDPTPSRPPFLPGVPESGAAL